jgi:hypothetical protein
MIGPLVFLLLAGVVVMFDPFMIMGRFHGTPAERRPGVPTHACAHADRRPLAGVGRPLRRAEHEHRAPRSRTPQNR